MRNVRWCCRCQRVIDLNHVEGGELECPYCGVSAGNLQTWESIKAANPHLPNTPVIGESYQPKTDPCRAGNPEASV